MKDILREVKNSRLIKFVLISAVIIFTADILFPLPELKEYSKSVYSKDGTLLTAYLTKDDKWRMRTRLDEVSPDLIKAIIEKEDKWFYLHPGVNPAAVIRALYSNITTGRRVSGASTITMQTARLLEPAERTYWNKFTEMLRAFQLELHYSKDEILGIYLSHLPFGGNIEGVKSASYIYFNRPPDKLSLSQAVMLTLIPNDPNSRRLDLGPEIDTKERDKWLYKLKEEKVFPDEAVKDALEEPLNSNRYAVPVMAPHFSYAVSDKYKGDILNTTLDPKIQRKAETLLANYVNRIKGQGISNGAVIIIDNSNSAIRAYCGSADFFDDKSSGQVNGIIAVRSPGSALKPFLFSQAFDMGILTPKMRLADIPTDFGGYEPENYSEEFNGWVTAEYALEQSLNVPAVRLLKQVEYASFINLMEKGGFRRIADDKNRLGLSVILGGCGVTLEELTRMYSAYARGGILHGLSYLEDENNEFTQQIFSEGSAFITGKILSGNKRPDFPAGLTDETKLPLIAWKTGTSYGKRDAWAVGFNPYYTIGVWMGNFDGTGSPHLIGRETAVPLLFELFNSVSYDTETKWFAKPEQVQYRDVDFNDGLLPSEYSANTIKDYYIEGVSHNKKSDLYKEVYVNGDTTISYCTECLPVSGYKKAAYPFYPPELLLWYVQENVPFTQPPPHNPECTAVFDGEGPVITSPTEEFEYYIDENNPEEILLLAASSPDITEHHWYINGRYYKSCKPGEKVFFTPKHGLVKITCMDDRGRERSVRVSIKSY